MGITVQPADWRQDVSGWNVRVINGTGADINLNPPDGLRVSFLVYRNDPNAGTDGQWKRLTSTLVSCLDGNGDGIPCTNNFADLTFQDPSLSIPTDIPIGQHLLVLTRDIDGIPHNADDAPYLIGINRVTSRVSFFARTVLPKVEMLIK